jgi:lipid II:glycine glycyltransferase (peptidoglycan interpeptide bridge formation enzyme)
MRVSVRRGGLDPQWDAFVDATPGGHHVQASAWGEVKSALGWHSVRVVLDEDGEVVGGAQLLMRRLHRGVKLAFVPRGPLGAGGDLALARAALEGVEQAARRERLLYLKLQPPAVHAPLAAELPARGFVASGLEAAPTATVRVSLDAPLEELERRMRKNAQRNVRRARSLGVRVREGTEADLPVFYDLLLRTARRQAFVPYPEVYYRAMLRSFGPQGRAAVLRADDDEGRPAAALLMLALGDTAACKMSAACVGPDAIRATELLHLGGMAWAQQRGYRFYDLDGLDPELARRWAQGERSPGRGVGHFKLGLGGEVVLAPGAFDRCFHPLVRPLASAVAPRVQAWAPVARRLLGRGA